MIEEFNKHKINFVVLKGLTLKKFNEKRRSGDLDILVDRKDLEKAFEISKRWFDFDSRVMRKLVRLNFMGVHHVSLHNKSYLPLEIHRDLVPMMGATTLKILNDSNKTFIEFNKHKIPCLIPEFQLIGNSIHLLLHLVYDNLEIARENKWIKDFNIITDNYDIRWGLFIKLLKRYGYQDLIFMLDHILKERCNYKLPIPDPVRRKIYEISSKWRIYLMKNLFEKVPLGTKKILFNLYLSRLFGCMLHFLLRRIYPKTAKSVVVC